MIQGNFWFHLNSLTTLISPKFLQFSVIISLSLEFHCLSYWLMYMSKRSYFVLQNESFVFVWKEGYLVDYFEWKFLNLMILKWEHFYTNELPLRVTQFQEDLPEALLWRIHTLDYLSESRGLALLYWSQLIYWCYKPSKLVRIYSFSPATFQLTGGIEISHILWNNRFFFPSNLKPSDLQ